ncbi:uncharacterized protein MAM_00648 [Metarhizium album ARSEF 1941]|uniref:Uncharacterized protein n=1 Tax=Metarhizium album (strain ARSEF 1941) TaxID=1081103 RepID=A0A0B2WZC1_METAS|nr:uncharacterized protein MAM_00648 [Metarhizium album ARSEF 1941]KHO01647.1 hypothetical protein MAM_00648 [Metarhizium album ARSEF 1941]
MPDLNSVPPSPHSLALSRRQSSHQMAPPPHSHPPVASPSPPSSINILPSNQNALSHAHSRSASLSQPHGASLPASPQFAAAQPMQPQPLHLSGDASVGPGPGPLRHPRPLTASELHMQLEKEQEAVVNRLTRELSLLRAAQNASVVSNASSTSASASTHDPITESSLLSGSGFTIPTTRRHHRNSSSASQNHGLQQLASSYEARHAVPRPAQSIPLSRQSSHSRISRTNSPGPQPSALDPSSYFHSQRVPHPTSVAMSSVAATPGSGSLADQMSPGLMPATMRFEETAFYRNELESAKKENETLKRRIRELERMVQTRRSTEVARPRSDSVSTTASVSVAPSGGVSIAGPRDSTVPQRPERERGMTSQSVTSVAVGVPDDEVKVGESAASSGLAGQQRQ